MMDHDLNQSLTQGLHAPLADVLLDLPQDLERDKDALLADLPSLRSFCIDQLRGDIDDGWGCIMPDFNVCLGGCHDAYWSEFMYDNVATACRQMVTTRHCWRNGGDVLVLWTDTEDNVPVLAACSMPGGWIVWSCFDGHPDVLTHTFKFSNSDGSSEPEAFDASIASARQVFRYITRQANQFVYCAEH